MSTAAFRGARDFLLSQRLDYETAYAGFRWPTLHHFNWALDWFDAALAGEAESRDRPALRILDQATGVETQLSFAELAERSSRIANHLRGLGVRRGERILLMLGNVVPLWETMLAAMKLGAVVIPASTLLTEADLVDRVRRGRVRHIVAAREQTALLERAGDGCTRIVVGGAMPGWHDFEAGYAASAPFVPDGPTPADSPMLLYFTSGTTAEPKLVLHSHQSYPVGALSTMYWLGLQPGDMHLNISSPGWAKHAWSSLFAPWNAGATVAVVNQKRFEAKALLDAVVELGVTSLCAPPTVWRLLIQEDLSAWRPALRELCGAGEPLNPEVIERVEAAWGLTIRDGYGQTETTAQIANPPGQRVEAGSMGRPLPGYRVVLLDVNDAAAEEGEVSLALGAERPLGLMRGYARDDGDADEVPGPFYRTGDVARRGAEGYLTYVGRADDLFKASGYRISPFELESVLIEHPAVAEAAVVPSPDPIRLAVPKAFISLVATAEPDKETALSIFRHLRDRLAPVQAGAAPGVRGPAQDHLGQDQAGRAAPRGSLEHGGRPAAIGRVPRGGFPGTRLIRRAQDGATAGLRPASCLCRSSQRRGCELATMMVRVACAAPACARLQKGRARPVPVGRRPRWAAILIASLVASSAVALFAELGPTARRALPVALAREWVPPSSRPALVSAAEPLRMCSTRYGYCPVGPLRAFDPCRCPHPLRGSVPGKVWVLGGTLPADHGGWAGDLVVEPGRKLGPQEPP